MLFQIIRTLLEEFLAEMLDEYDGLQLKSQNKLDRH